MAAFRYAERSGCEATARADRRWRGWPGPVRRGFIQTLRNQGPWRPCTQASGSPESARRQASRAIVDPGLGLDYVTTVLAALLVGTGFVLQQRAAAMEPASRFPSIRLIIDLFRKPRWLAGIGLLVGGDILAAWSIGHLELSLTQNAFSAGPLQASLPAISAGEPLIGILLGVIVFGDRIQISPGLLAIQAGGVAALVAGVVMVASDPALSQLREQASKPHRRPRYRQRRRYACCRRVRVNCSTACSTAAAHCPGDWGTMTCASCSTDASRYRSWLAPLPAPSCAGSGGGRGDGQTGGGPSDRGDRTWAFIRTPPWTARRPVRAGPRRTGPEARVTGGRAVPRRREGRAEKRFPKWLPMRRQLPLLA